jgi:hypothetical protein
VLVPKPQGLMNPEIDDSLRKHDESDKRLEDLERQRRDAVRVLEQEARELEEP